MSAAPQLEAVEPGAGDPRSATAMPLAGLLSLLVVYVVWGSTYLAIRVAVREGAGFGPFWLGGTRVLLAGAILLAVAALSGMRMRPAARELPIILGSGALLWVGGNGGVNWAEQHLGSGLVALIVGTVPLSVAAIEAWLDRRAPTLLLVASLATGFVLLATLTVPTLRSGTHADLVAVGVVLVASLSWGCGSLLLSRRPLHLEPIVVSAYQQLAGSIGFAALALAAGERAPAPTGSAWTAWAYLVVMGSLVGFTSYVVALKALPTSIVMTYSYVNPVIAVTLGWLILHEQVTATTLAGMALVVLGVAGVFRDRALRARRPAPG